MDRERRVWVGEGGNNKGEGGGGGRIKRRSSKFRCPNVPLELEQVLKTENQ